MSIADCVSLLKAWPELAANQGVTTSNCCSVSGVSCNSDNRITTMSLNGYSFSTANLGVKTSIGGLMINPGNPIPLALFELTEISNLWMTGAGLSGEIPEGWAAMTQLNELHLESNQFTGGFPNDWAHLPNFQFFHADDNLLTILPTTNSIASPSLKLKTCLIQNNRFSGKVPDEWMGSNLIGSWVDLWGNCLSGVSAEVNAVMYDQQANCAGVDTSFESKCWEVNPKCANVINHPQNGGAPISIPVAALATSAAAASATAVTTGAATTTSAVATTASVKANATVAAATTAVAVKSTTSSAMQVGGVVVSVLMGVMCL
ncbi:hypothetical protein HDU98_011937 [Podochytrium sp. JEL0797]|nr:hypothetical protein HDU98_011937 [Podochytrium sp. JEL0797]